MRKILFLLLITTALNTYAQVGPNLAAGAGGLVLNKGELDAQLILDIVATKKGEIKTELGKRLILNKLEGSSFALYRYAEKNLNLLFSQSKKEVITKELMQNSAELLLVYGMAEYILQDIASADSNAIDTTLVNFLQELYYQVDLVNKDSLESKLGLKLSLPVRDSIIENTPFYEKNVRISSRDSNKVRAYVQDDYDQKAKENNNQYKVVKESKRNPNESRYLLKPEITAYLSNRDNPKYMESKDNYYSAMSMFADLIYDACLNNNEVKETGLFQSDNINILRYKELSKYWYFREYPKIFKPLTDYKPKIDSILTYLFGYYNLLKQVKNLYDTDPAELNRLVSSITSLKIAEGDTLLEKLKKDIRDVSSNGKSSEAKNVYDDEIAINKRIQNFTKYIPRFVNSLADSLAGDTTFKKRISYAKRYLDLAYTIQKEIIPKLSTLSAIREGNYDTVLKTCEELYQVLFDNAVFLFGKDKSMVTETILTLRNYLPLLDIINNLDRVESYDYMFKFLTGIAETIGDERSKAAVEAITGFVNKYTTIDKDENKIQIDVEGIALNMYDKFSKNQHGRVNMLFTVGVNHNTSTSDNLKFINDNSANPDSVGYSMFFSEKIGLQWNIIDWNRRRAFHHYNLKGEISKHQAAKMGVNPMINNIHMVLYGSGLLYQVKVLNSDDNFTQPIVGTGIGVTFFNGLSFNASYAATYSNLRRGFISLGFDIAITEYLGAVRSKSKSQ